MITYAAPLNTLDKEIVDSSEFKEVVSFCKSVAPIYIDKQSWLLQIVEDVCGEFEMYDNNPEDPRWDVFRSDTIYSPSWYCALNHCDVYSYLLARYLEIKNPNTNYEIVYYNDHYVVIERSGDSIIVHDLLYWCKSRAGFNYKLKHDMFERRHTIRTIKEHRRHMENGEYGY